MYPPYMKMQLFKYLVIIFHLLLLVPFKWVMKLWVVFVNKWTKVLITIVTYHRAVKLA